MNDRKSEQAWTRRPDLNHVAGHDHAHDGRTDEESRTGRNAPA